MCYAQVAMYECEFSLRDASQARITTVDIMRATTSSFCRVYSLNFYMLLSHQTI